MGAERNTKERVMRNFARTGYQEHPSLLPMAAGETVNDILDYLQDEYVEENCFQTRRLVSRISRPDGTTDFYEVEVQVLKTPLRCHPDKAGAMYHAYAANDNEQLDLFDDQG